MKAKKLLIIFLIVALFVAAILTTVFVFFSNRKTKDVNVVDVSNYVKNLENSKNMKESKALITELKSEDSRFEGIVEVIDNFDDIISVLMLYTANLNFKFENDDLYSKINSSNSNLSYLHDVVSEYNKKKESAYFDKKLGANDLLSATCNYLCSYADLTLSFISFLGDRVSANSDLRCSIFDLYSRVVKTTFGKTEVNETTKLRVVSVLSNITLMNEKFELVNSQLSNLSQSALSQYAGLFCINYNLLDKDVYASQLFTNVKDEITLTQNSTLIEKASYYFREIYGI